MVKIIFLIHQILRCLLLMIRQRQIQRHLFSTCLVLLSKVSEWFSISHLTKNKELRECKDQYGNTDWG